jgi:hypothetical protein
MVSTDNEFLCEAKPADYAGNSDKACCSTATIRRFVARSFTAIRLVALSLPDLCLLNLA